jgi:hypothetical protein
MARPRCGACGRALPSPRLTPAKVILDQPVLRIARRLVGVAERRPRGVHRSDFQRALGKKDRQWLDDAIVYCLDRRWLTVDEIHSPRTGKLFARLFRLGEFVPPGPTARERIAVRRRPAPNEVNE